MKKQSWRIPTIAVVLTIFLGMLGVLVSSPRSGAQPPEGPCSNKTLRGDYGFAVEGQVLGGPFAGLLRALAMTHFDGEGNLTQVDFATINGAPIFDDWRPVVGTYMVDGNCTGTAQLVASDGSPTLNLRLIAVRNGREIHTVVVEEGNSVSSIGIRRN